MAAIRFLPLALTLSRFALAAAVLAAALARPAPAIFGACIAAAFLSDVFDGMIARSLGVASSGLRRLDSVADTVFCLGAVAAIWLLRPAVIHDHAPALLSLAALELLRYALDLAKFRREASYHMWSSRLWGLSLYAAFMWVLALDRAGVVVDVAIGLGIAADLEGIAISLVLPEWRHDVATIVHAWRIRRRPTHA